MLPLVEVPELVRHYAPYFASVFSAEALVEFERYISGLIVSENKTIEGINRLFVLDSRNQSSLNRLLTASPFSLEALNQARLQVLEERPRTQRKHNGVLSVDDTLLTHYGEHFDQIAVLRDPIQERFVWAHNLVTLHYSDEETDYPLRFRLWLPPDVDRLEAGLVQAGVRLKAEKQGWKRQAPPKWRNYLLGVWRRHQDDPGMPELHQSKQRIAEHLVEEWLQAHPQDRHLPVTFDAWYTQAGFCHFLDRTLKLAYVGALSEDDQLILQSGPQRLDRFTAHLQQEHWTAQKEQRPLPFRPIRVHFKGETEVYYSYCATHRLNKFGRQRLVISFEQPDLSDHPVFYISNRLHWQAPGIMRIRRHRWPVEVYYEEGKAEGLDQYQVRDFQAIERHIALVAVVYSLLRAAQHDRVLRRKLQRQLKLELEGSPVSWRRATQAHCLWSLALFISASLAQGQTLSAIMPPLLQSLCSR